MQNLAVQQLIGSSQVALSSGDASSLSGVTSMAGELVTWSITQMGAFIDFIITHPLVLAPFLLGLVGFGVGLLMRIWRSV